MSSQSRDIQLYDMHATTVYAHARDPRFSYTLYVPPAIREPGNDVRLVVVVHGTGRQFIGYRDAFAQFGRWNNCMILCPLFPVGVAGDGNRDGFKHLQEGDIRYDQVLLDIVDDVGQKYGTTFSDFGLFGYSGGGQFVNRFCYLHPERLWAASIGAPGSVTLLDTDQQWWVGLAGMQERFGKALDLPALQRVPVQMIVGKADLETWEITHRPGGRHYMEGANEAGATRVERLNTLCRSFQAAGVEVDLRVLDNVPHDGMKCVGQVQEFLASVLCRLRGAAPQAGGC